MGQTLYFFPVFVIFIFVSSAGADVKLEMDTSAKCFSCMSEIYETMWSEIDGVYKKPKDFTDECNAENISPTLVRTISCPHVCVSIKEDIKVGDTITKGYIRGCMDSILKNDFNQTIVNLYRWLHKDACRSYQKRSLFNLPIGLYDDTSFVHLCTCFSNFCNTGMGTHTFAHLKKEKGSKGTLKAKNSVNRGYSCAILYMMLSIVHLLFSYK